VKRYFLLLAALLLHAEIYPVDITPAATKSLSGSRDLIFGNIRILDQKEIILPQLSGIPFSEASDLAYDNKTHKLYMVGDKGFLYVFEAFFSDKIKHLMPLSAYRLTKEKGKPFKKKVDSEGLAFNKRGELLISFERRPKIGAFDLHGQRLFRYRLPDPLRQKKQYRSKNKMLESVTWHPKYGILTVAEFPIKSDAMHRQTLYSLQGRQWHFLSEPETKSAVTAIEVMDDGNILVLERAYTSITEPRTITLKKIFLKEVKEGICRSKVLLKMSSAKGWKNDNFEGLAKVAPYRYLIVSDDNNNFFQRTLLLYFEVIE